MDWQGTAQGALEEMIANPTLEPNYWHPSRVLRGIIDSQVSGQPRINLINETVATASEVYAGTPNIDRMTRLRSAMDEHGLPHAVLTQTYDGRTVESSSPGKTEQSAKLMAEEIEGPILMIPLCHGGFAAGIQAELALRRLKPDADTAVYPVRNSMRKHQDKAPHVSRAEMKHLRELAKGRTVVVFDEDSITGASIHSAVQHFAPRLGAARTIGVANADKRMPDDIEAQGRLWEKSVATAPKPPLRERIRNWIGR